LLSFERGKPIAKIYDRRGPDHGQIIYVQPEANASVSELKVRTKNPVEELGEKFFTKRLTRIKPKELSVLNEALKRNEAPLNYPHLLDVYNQAVEELNGSAGKEIKLLGTGIIIPIYDPLAQREVDYISGMAGVGKSTYTAMRTEQWLDIRPEGNVYMFSELREDPAFDNIGLTRIIINDELLDPENPIRPEEFKDSLVIFDDIDAIIDQKLLKVVRKLRDQMLAVGRHDNISVICTTHILCNAHETKVPLNEATAVTIFPQAGAGIDNIRLYFKKCGIPKHTVDKILAIKSRWVTHRKCYPGAIIHEHGVFLL